MAGAVSVDQSLMSTSNENIVIPQWAVECRDCHILIIPQILSEVSVSQSLMCGLNMCECGGMGGGSMVGDIYMYIYIYKYT